MEMCPYCIEDSDGYVKPLEKNSHAFIRFGMGGWEIDISAKGWHGSAKIRYCPMCGRKLNKGDKMSNDITSRKAVMEWASKIPAHDLSDGRGLCRVIFAEDFLNALKYLPSAESERKKGEEE